DCWLSHEVGGLRTVGPSTVRVPGGVTTQKPSGTPITQAARVDTFARFHLWKPVVIFEPTLKERPRVGGGASGGHSETLEGSCLTFTTNTTALHSVPIAGEASFAKTRAPPNRRRAGFSGTLIGTFRGSQRGSGELSRPIGLHGPDSSENKVTIPSNRL